jgi:hypothetical protein
MTDASLLDLYKPKLTRTLLRCLLCSSEHLAMGGVVLPQATSA